MKLYTHLREFGEVYLNGHHGRSVVNTAVKLINFYHKRESFVPGFFEVHVYTSKRNHAKLRKEIRAVETIASIVSYLPIKGQADIVWIDDLSLTAAEVRALYLKYSTNFIIYSGRKKEGLQLMVDSREQRPLWEKGKCKRIKLEVGDYTTEKLHNKFHIERKSLVDLYGSITKGHVRFRNELIRAKLSNIRLGLYVAGSRARFIAKDFYGGKDRKSKGETLERIVNTMETKYGIEVVWCKSEADLKIKILQRFKLEENGSVC